MTNQDYDQIEIISNNIHQIKQTLIKTPIITDEELEKLEQDENKNYEQLMKTFEKFCNFFTKELDYLINQPTEQDAQQTEEDNKDKKGGKGAPAQDKGGKKGAGGSDQQQFYESPLKPTLGSVESITLLVDNQLYDLPFENLDVLKNIPAKSRDFSFYFLLKRYQKIQFSPQANNSTQAGGLQRDKLKYICYDFKSEEGNNGEINACHMIKEGIQDGVFSNLKFQGVRSDERIASIGEWQHFLFNSSLLLFYAHSSILDIMSPKFLCDMIEINETKGFVVFDRINCRKTLIQKSSPLDIDGQKVPIADQPLKTSILLTLLGCTNIAINQWSIKPEEYIKALKSMLVEFNKEIYFSAILNNYKEPKVVYINKLGQIVDINKLQDDKQKQGQATSKDPKKQGKKDDKKEEIEQQQISIEDLQKFTEVKKLIYTDNVQFIGVPVIRLT